MKPNNYITPHSHSPLMLVAFTSVVFAVSSCGSGNNSPSSSEASGPVLSETSTSDALRQVLQPEGQVSGPLQADFNSPVQYPVDTEKDDRAGLIITGVNAEDIQSMESPFLLSASAFRLEGKSPGSGDGYVHMVVYDEARPVSAHIEFYQPPLNSCLLRDVESDDSEGFSVLDPSASGGVGVVINSPSGPWFTFERQEIDSSQYLYQVENELPGPFPIDATLSIPGDVYPNLSAHPIFEPYAVERLLPTKGDAVTPSSNFSWVAGPESGYVKINLLAYDESNEFRGFAVTCWGGDDGQFEMPATVMDYLARSELTHKVRYSRVYARLDWINGMVIHQDIEVAE